MKLCLGTVQFGMEYGIANVTGQPSIEQSLEMLQYAIDNGISVIDTANAYGSSEEIVGQFLNETHKSSKIITKLKPNIFENLYSNPKNIIQQELKNSLSKLGTNSVDGFLLHTPQYIYKKDILDALMTVKHLGLTQNIGVSIYEMEDGFAAIESCVLDYIQLPFSVFDQRAYHSGLLKKASESGITIFARSSFVQGLAIMSAEHVAGRMKPFLPHLISFEKLINKYHLDKVGALLAFVRETSGIDYLVFGVDNIAQLNENIKKFTNYNIPREFIAEAKMIFKEVDRNVIIPSLWTLK